MESKISEVGRTAIRIGEQLESVHASRLRAQAAHDLIDYYIQFSQNDVTKLENLRKEGGKEGRMKVAILLRRISTAAKEVDIPIAEKVTPSSPPQIGLYLSFQRPRRTLTSIAKSLRRICYVCLIGVTVKETLL